MSFLKKEYKYLLFILPAFLIYTIITVVPVFYTFFYSLTDFNGLSKDYTLSAWKTMSKSLRHPTSGSRS